MEYSSATTPAPSPIAAPTRFTEPDRASPMANTPPTLVSSGSARPDRLFDERTSGGTSGPVKMKFLASKTTLQACRAGAHHPSKQRCTAGPCAPRICAICPRNRPVAVQFPRHAQRCRARPRARVVRINSRSGHPISKSDRRTHAESPAQRCLDRTYAVYSAGSSH
jgi:hypothetical protein